MNRKDTILIAVLINAGLLVVLFATALKTEKQVPEQPIAYQQIEIQKPKLERKELPKPAAPKPVAVAPKPAPAPVKKTPEPVKKTAPKPEPAKTEFRTHVVQSGDALEKIARRNGVTVASLMEANNLKSTSLKIGQEIVIPGAMKTSDAVKKQHRTYEVRAGDSPWTIASKNKIKLEELLSLNDLDEASAKKLKPGDKLRIE